MKWKKLFCFLLATVMLLICFPLSIIINAQEINPSLPAEDLNIAPAISGDTTMVLSEGYEARSTAAYEVTGNPEPTVQQDENYEGKIVWNEVSKTLDLAEGLPAGNYFVVLTASNGLETEASLTFILTIEAAPPIPENFGLSSAILSAGNDTLLQALTYWTQAVTAKPDGYVITDSGNVEISSAEGLAWLISVVNGLNGQKVPVDFSGKTVTLTNDIDLSAYEWTPIGNDLKPFSGIFEGGGQSISGIAVNMTEDDIYGESCAGLFGRIEGATVKNVSVLGDINALAAGQNNYAGGIVGFNESSTVSNCSFSGKVNASGIVTGANYAGGICGHNYSGEKVAALESCNNGGTVTAMNSGGVNFAGGITGNNYGNLANCSNSGSVHSSGSTNLSRNDAGGIAGYNYETGNVVNCFNIGQVSASGDVVDNNAGGVIGNNYGVVANCYNTGAISAIGEDGRNEAGGNSGYNGGSVKNCYNSGNVTASGAGSQNEAGGISGYNQGDLDNCYNIGHVSASVGSESNFDGGIAGYAEDVSSVSNCYWLDTSAAQGIGKNCLYSATNCSSFTEAQGKGTKADFNFKIGTDANAGFGTGTLLDALNAWVTKQGSQDLLTQTLHDYLNWIIIADVNSGYPILRSLCTVTFDANGGTVNPTQISVSRGAPYGELPVPARSGFSFDGWFTSADSGEEITENSIFTTPDSSQILYAHWTALAPLAISGGTSAMRLQAGYTDTSTEPFIISGNPFPSISQNTTHGGKIVWNDKTRFLDIFAGLPAGVYPVVLTAEVISDISISSFTLSGYAATMVAGAMDTEPGNTLTFTLTVEAKPTEPSEPTDPSASEPTEPSDASEPTKPDEPSQPSEPTIPGGSDDPSDNTDPSEQIGPAESEVIIPITGEEEPMPPWLLLFLALSITGTAWFHRKRKSEEKR